MMLTRLKAAVAAGICAAIMDWRGWRIDGWYLPEPGSDYLHGASLMYDSCKGPSIVKDPGWIVSRFGTTYGHRFKSFATAIAVAEHWVKHKRLP